MAEYSKNKLIELSKGAFKCAPHIPVFYAQKNGTFLNQVQYDKLKAAAAKETDTKKKAAYQEHLDGILVIENPSMKKDEPEADAKAAAKAEAAAKATEAKAAADAKAAEAKAAADAKKAEAKAAADAKKAKS